MRTPSLSSSPPPRRDTSSNKNSNTITKKSILSRRRYSPPVLFLIVVAPVSCIAPPGPSSIAAALSFSSSTVSIKPPFINASRQHQPQHRQRQSACATTISSSKRLVSPNNNNTNNYANRPSPLPMASSNNNDDDDTISTITTTTATTNFIALVGSNTSPVVAGTFFLALAYRQDTYMWTFWIGSILNAIASKVLKRILNQDRPDDDDTAVSAADDDGTTVEMGVSKPNDKGMPSSHAMSLGFIGMYTSIGLWNSLTQLASSVSSSNTIGSFFVIASTVYGLIWSYVAVSLIYRVKSRLHTIEQVWVGLFFGVTNALFWNSLAHGTNPLIPSANVMDTVSFYVLPEGSGTFVQCLVVPAVVGLLVIGSVERRIGGWWRKVKQR